MCKWETEAQRGSDTQSHTAEIRTRIICPQLCSLPQKILEEKKILEKPLGLCLAHGLSGLHWRSGVWEGLRDPLHNKSEPCSSAHIMSQRHHRDTIVIVAGPP